MHISNKQELFAFIIFAMKPAHRTEDSHTHPTEPSTPDGEAAPARRVRHVSSDLLFDGANEIEIEHHGAHYRLRKTSLGKLILTK